MTYSVDYRSLVVNFVRSGGSKAEASRRFLVSIWCVKDWCKRDNLLPKEPGRRKRKLDWDGLLNHIKQYPDIILRERAKEFNVNINAIWYASKALGYSHKKKFSLPRKKASSKNKLSTKITSNC